MQLWDLLIPSYLLDWVMFYHKNISYNTTALWFNTNYSRFSASAKSLYLLLAFLLVIKFSKLIIFIGIESIISIIFYKKFRKSVQEISDNDSIFNDRLSQLHILLYFRFVIVRTL